MSSLKVKILYARDYDNRFSYDFCRGVFFPNSCDDLSLLGAKVHLELEQFIGFWDPFGGEDLGDFQVNLLKVYSPTLQGEGAMRNFCLPLMQ